MKEFRVYWEYRGKPRFTPWKAFDEQNPDANDSPDGWIRYFDRDPDCENARIEWR